MCLRLILNWRLHFSLLLFVRPPFLSMFLSTERPCWSSGRYLIAYLFSLSYSKLLWVWILLRTEFFFPPLLLLTFHPVPPSNLPLPYLPVTNIVACAACWLTVAFTQLFLCVINLDIQFFLIILFWIVPFISFVIYESRIASVVCNSLWGRQMFPPPSQCYWQTLARLDRELTMTPRLPSSMT